eukprot:7378549-Prymnesium_polylepis.1
MGGERRRRRARQVGGLGDHGRRGREAGAGAHDRAGGAGGSTRTAPPQLGECRPHRFVDRVEWVLHHLLQQDAGLLAQGGLGAGVELGGPRDEAVRVHGEDAELQLERRALRILLGHAVRDVHIAADHADGGGHAAPPLLCLGEPGARAASATLEGHRRRAWLWPVRKWRLPLVLPDQIWMYA